MLGSRTDFSDSLSSQNFSHAVQYRNANIMYVNILVICGYCYVINYETLGFTHNHNMRLMCDVQLVITILLHLVTYVHMYPNQKHPSCKKSCSQDLKKGCYKKDVKSKGDGQGLCRNAVDHIKNFDNDNPGHKTCFQILAATFLGCFLVRTSRFLVIILINI